MHSCIHNLLCQPYVSCNICVYMCPSQQFWYVFELVFVYVSVYHSKEFAGRSVLVCILLICSVVDLFVLSTIVVHVFVHRLKEFASRSVLYGD